MNDTIEQLITTSARFIKRHGADIFAVLAGIGVVATGVSAYSAGKEMAGLQELRESEDPDIGEDGDDEDRRSNAKVLARPVLFGVGTIGAIAASRYFGYKREESLLAASTALALYSQRKGRTDVECEPVDEPVDLDTIEVEDTGTGDLLFIEDFTGRRFKASVEVVEYSIRKLQSMYQSCNCACLNDFYGLLGIAPTSAGDVLGWSVNMQILDPYLDEEDYDDMKDAITDLEIFVRYYEGLGYVIHYPYLPVGGLAGVGPCNY